MPATILQYWQQCHERGENPRPVWMIVSLGGQQPQGYCMAWSINKRAASKMHSEICQRTMSQHAIIRVSQ